MSKVYNPSPDTIREITKKIQSEWDEKEYQKRSSQTSSENWMPPVVNIVIEEDNED